MKILKRKMEFNCHTPEPWIRQNWLYGSRNAHVDKAGNCRRLPQMGNIFRVFAHLGGQSDPGLESCWATSSLIRLRACGIVPIYARPLDSAIKLFDGVDHGNKIFHRRVGQYIVNGIEYKPTVG
jgi:hypothetical protein